MDNDEVKVTEVSQDMEVIYQQDKAMVDMQISTAKAYPRNIKRATENAIAIVTMNEETARSCNYAVPRGGKRISGPSVHLAKILLQNWGNLRVEAKVIDISDKHITSQAIAFDLETNIAVKVEVKRSIMGKRGRFNDDMITVTGNAANSIALRNAVFNVIPKSVVDTAYNAATKKIVGDVSDKSKLITKRKQIFEGLTDTYQITEAEVLSVIGKSALANVTQDDIVTLIGIAQALKDGDVTIEETFKKKKPNLDKSIKEKETKRIADWIKKAKTKKELETVEEKVMKNSDPNLLDLYTSKFETIKEAKDE